MEEREEGTEAQEDVQQEDVQLPEDPVEDLEPEGDEADEVKGGFAANKKI